MIKRYAYNPDQAWSAADDGEWVRFEDYIEDLKNKISSYHDYYDGVRGLNESLNGELNRLTEENKELKEGIERLRNQLFEDDARHLISSANLEVENNTLREERKELKEKIASLQANNAMERKHARALRFQLWDRKYFGIDASWEIEEVEKWKKTAEDLESKLENAELWNARHENKLDAIGNMIFIAQRTIYPNLVTAIDKVLKETNECSDST